MKKVLIMALFVSLLSACTFVGTNRCDSACEEDTTLVDTIYIDSLSIDTVI